MTKILTFITICFLLGNNQIFSQIPDLNWKFETDGKILSSAKFSDGLVYFGSNDHHFYAVESTTGSLKWKFKSKDIVKGAPIILRDLVFFESGNIFYALQKSSGEIKWKYNPGDTLYHSQIDKYDDHRSEPILHNDIIYVGGSNGHLYGFEASTGTIKLDISSDKNSPIRSTPFIKDDILFFGDWNGVLYAYELDKNQFKWRRKTFDFPKPYGTFGGISSGITEFNRKIFFGARNHMFNVLDFDTGNLTWSYTSPEGGWMFGTPVVVDSTVYIGGSDNQSMHAFTTTTGSLLWKFNAGQNIMGKPLVTDKFVIFLSGNLYNIKELGNLYCISREDGSLVSKIPVPGPSISSPLRVNNDIIFGCFDGVLYSLTMPILKTEEGISKE